MTRAHVRGARREREAAKILGTQRVHRARYESRPDCEPVRLENGEVLQPEVATRTKLPALLRLKIAQARRYAPAAIPLVIISETGGEALAVMPLRDLARLIGLQPLPKKQLALLLGGEQ